MNLRNIFLFMTLALGSESQNTLGTTGKGLLTTGLSLQLINGKVCFVKNSFPSIFYPELRSTLFNEHRIH